MQHRLGPPHRRRPSEWTLGILRNNESDLAFWNTLRHLITGFIFFP